MKLIIKVLLTALVLYSKSLYAHLEEVDAVTFDYSIFQPIPVIEKVFIETDDIVMVKDITRNFSFVPKDYKLLHIYLKNYDIIIIIKI